ncbi:MAG: hypothetical protein ACREID_09610, partial [Planctomycetota bacterium]
MRRRSAAARRAFALLFLGVTAGAALFLARHLSPRKLEDQVRDALSRVLAAPFRLDAVGLDIGAGVELVGLKVLYPDGEAVFEAERVVLAMTQEELLRGNVQIRQIDIVGPVLRLRPQPGRGDELALPGLLRSPPAVSAPAVPLPVVRVLPGRRKGRVEISGLPVLDPSRRIDFLVEDAEGRPDGPLYVIEAVLGGDRAGRANLSVSIDPVGRTVAARAAVEGVELTPGDRDKLRPDIRAQFGGLVVGGRADVIASAVFDLERRSLQDFSVEARLFELQGSLPAGGPADASRAAFRLEQGSGKILFRGDRLQVPSLTGVYVSPDGREGLLDARLSVDLASPGHDFDFQLRGHKIAAMSADLRLLLDPEVVENIVDKYLPGGVLDFDVRVTRRFGLPDRAEAVLDLHEGLFEYAGPLDRLTGERFGFRYPLERCAGRLRLATNAPSGRGPVNVITLEGIRGFRPPRGGVASEVRVVANGRVVSYVNPSMRGAEDADVRIVVLGLPIDADLAAAFASNPDGPPYRGFDLAGAAEVVRIHVRRDGPGDDVPRADYHVTLRDCAIAYRGFPLRVEGVAGTIVSRATGGPDGERREMEIFRLTGRAPDGGTVRGWGKTVQGPGREETLDFHVRAADLGLGPRFEEAMAASALAESGLREFWAQARPEGAIDADLVVRGGEDVEVAVDLAGKAHLGRLGPVAFPARGLRGRLVYRPGRLAFEDVRGEIEGIPFRVWGGLETDGALEISGEIRALVLDERTRRLALQAAPALGRAFELLPLGPESRLRLSVRAERAARGAPLSVRAEGDDLALETEFRGTRATVRGGPLSLEGDRLEAHGLRVEMGGASADVKQLAVVLREGGGGRVLLDAEGLDAEHHLGAVLGADLHEVMGGILRADLVGLEASFNRPDGKVVLTGGLDLRRHEMPATRARSLEPTGAFELGPLTVTPPAGDGRPLSFSGLIRFHGVNFNIAVPLHDLSGQLLVGEGTLDGGLRVRGALREASATLMKRQIRTASMNLELEPHYLRLGGIEADFYGGSLAGDVEVHLADPAAFRVQARIDGADLGRMVREDLPRNERMAGVLDALLDVQSPDGAVEHLAGRGQVRVTEGALFEVESLRT